MLHLEMDTWQDLASLAAAKKFVAGLRNRVKLPYKFHVNTERLSNLPAILVWFCSHLMTEPSSCLVSSVCGVGLSTLVGGGRLVYRRKCLEKQCLSQCYHCRIDAC